MRTLYSTYLGSEIHIDEGPFRKSYYVGASGFASLETAQEWIEKKIELEKKWNSGEMQITSCYSQNFIQISMSSKDFPEFLHLLHPRCMEFYITNIGSKEGKIIFLTISSTKSKEETKQYLNELFKKVKE